MRNLYKNFLMKNMLKSGIKGKNRNEDGKAEERNIVERVNRKAEDSNESERLNRKTKDSNKSERASRRAEL